MVSDWTELILFTRGATNASVTDGTGKGAQWYVKYRTAVQTAGKTEVEWELYKRGRESTPRNLATTLNFYINGIKTVAIARSEFNEPNADGTNHPHKRYTAKENTTPTKTGRFTVDHDVNGKGSFTMQVEAAIYTQTLTAGSVRTVELPINLPQTPCYWASNATVTIDRTYIAPGGTFAVSWSGATAGVANAIKEFQVHYKIGNGVYTMAGIFNSTTTSGEFIMPSTATRGDQITVLVKIIDEKNITNADITNTSSIVNPALDSLIINDYSGKNTNNVFSYKDSTVFFDYTKPIKSTNQNITIEIKVDGVTVEGNEQSYAYTIPNNWAYGTSKTFELRATDGEEASDWQSIAITRNSNASSGGALTYNNYVFTCTVPENCTGTLGLTENKVITVVNGQKVDIRTLFNFDLKSGTSYGSLKGMLTCTCGVDSDKIEDERYRSFQVPNFKLSSSKDELPGYFDGTASTVQVLVKEGESWNPLDSSDWIFQGIDSVNPGAELNRVTMRGQNGNSFTVQMKEGIIAVKEFRLNFMIAEGKYKPYSEQPRFASLIEHNNWNKYGLTEAPTIRFQFGEGELYEGEYVTGSNDFVSYRLKNNADYYNIAKDFNSDNKPSFSFSYQYTNIYGNTITQYSTSSIELDFKEQAQIVNSETQHYICAIPPTKTWNTAYAIENWSYIKENMLFSTDFEIAATVEPEAWLEREIGAENWQKFYDFQVENTRNQVSNLFNIPVYVYKLSQKEKLGQIVDGTSGGIRLVVKTDSLENLVKVYNNKSEFEFAQHLSPLIKFTEVSYTPPLEVDGRGTILAQYEIMSSGSNQLTSNTYKCKVGTGTDEPVLGELKNESIEFPYTINGATYINIAPILITDLSATITINGNEETGFTTTYSTSVEDYEYITCYNLLPTIAYRQNYLGINTNNPAMNGEDSLTDPALTISAYNNHKMVHLVSSKNSASIDLETGAMLGFVVDCGSWSGIPGGIIPGGDTPTGLAAIAYTGQIRDLLEGDYEVILYGTDEKI